MKRILLVGGGGREHAIAEALVRAEPIELYAVMKDTRNPGIAAHTDGDDRLLVRDENDIETVAEWAVEKRIDFAVVGFEEPLGKGLCDELEKFGLQTIGPKKDAAQLETSKLFTRDLMKKYDVPGKVFNRRFSNVAELAEFLRSTDKQFVLKPIGLTAGKGVKVMGEQLNSVDDAIRYGREVIEKGIGNSSSVLVEEKLVGDEFTLQCFVDGKTIAPMPLVQDFKLALEGDKGPNTGGMGSYSQADGLLPFLSANDRKDAYSILVKLIEALSKEGIQYKGILYGQFMLTRNGVKLIEINARFGDPEAMNVLSLLETSLVTICEAIINESLSELEIKFSEKATVCTYVTPPGYPYEPKVDEPITVDVDSIKQLGACLYYAKVYAKVNQPPGSSNVVMTSSSRSLAVVGIADTLEQAYLKSKEALACINGNYHARGDIGTKYIRLNQETKGQARGAG